MLTHPWNNGTMRCKNNNKRVSRLKYVLNVGSERSRACASNVSIAVVAQQSHHNNATTLLFYLIQKKNRNRISSAANHRAECPPFVEHYEGTASLRCQATAASLWPCSFSSIYQMQTQLDKEAERRVVCGVCVFSSTSILYAT